jgi:uncharacterized protein with HEPN domain
MKQNDAVYLSHILDAITQIETYTAGLSYDQFSQTRLVQDGVIRQLKIIGEASRNLSDDFRDQHPELPWPQIISLRNRLIHAYFEVNLGIVWDIVQNDLPPLKHNVTEWLHKT